MIKNRNVGETLHDPKKMAIACGIIGMIVVAFQPHRLFCTGSAAGDGG
jgi:hypothetical protein